MRTDYFVAVMGLCIAACACTSLTAPLNQETSSAGASADSVNAEATSAAAVDETIAAIDTAGALEGVVLQQSGAALRNATVSVPGTEISTSTDSSGRFRITGLTGGKHVVMISMNGYAFRVTPLLTLPSTGAMQLTAVLSPAPTPVPPPPGTYRCGYVPAPLVIVDGTTVAARFGIHDMSAYQIATVALLSHVEALQGYGAQAASGVIVMETIRNRTIR